MISNFFNNFNHYHKLLLSTFVLCGYNNYFVHVLLMSQAVGFAVYWYTPCILNV